MAWPTVHRILIAAAVGLCAAPVASSMIGIYETRARSVRWLLAESGWRRSDSWMTSIVELDLTHRSGVLGLAPGRSGACVEDWWPLQTSDFRDAVRVVAIDPSAPYANQRAVGDRALKAGPDVFYHPYAPGWAAEGKLLYDDPAVPK
jgi:hypothetical protein